jgi:ATP-dependent helicase HrpB
VTVREEEMLGAIILESRVVRALPDDVSAAVLARLRCSGATGLFISSALSEQYRARVEFVRELLSKDDWPDISDSHLVATAEKWLPPVIAAENKFTGIDLLAVYRAALGWKKGEELERLAPTSITVPSGSRIKIDYTGEGGPSIAVKLQELFGLAVTPSIAEGRCPLTLQLLSPAGRPIQVTRDLESFWNSGYQIVRKELKGRYPKHPWPDDPWSAHPTRFLKKRPV